MSRSLVLLAGIWFAASGCLDVRDFEGTWTGQRVGQSDVLRRGFADNATATLAIEHADLRDMDARLTIPGVLENAVITPITGAEADVLSSMTFESSPARVFLAFASTVDSGGDALVMIALYNDPRVDVRVMRGGDVPLYGIFSLRSGPSTATRADGSGDSS